MDGESMKYMGWIPDHPDVRDYTSEQKEVTSPRLLVSNQKDSIKTMLDAVGVAKPVKTGLPASVVDLEKWCTPIEDQRHLGSCTAQAGVALVEFFENKAFGRYIDASRLFLYKVTRNLLHLQGDTGAYLRTTLGALVLFGVPPEEYWPYTDAKPDFDVEPSAFCYAFGQSYQAITYYRYDPPGTAKDVLLQRIKTNLAAGLPSMFGFSVYSSYGQAAKNQGKIPYPVLTENQVGGHAVCAVGYDDKMEIKNTNPGAEKTVGALRIRNSWGTDWGDAGYGWLPYDYVLKGLAVDWWSILKNEWVSTKEFSLKSHG